jgi:transcriptional regulator with XRE-family HTH domain
MNEVNKRFARWIEGSLMSDTEVADKIGVDRHYIYMMRTGRTPISDSFRWRFAQVYGYDFAVKLLEPTNGTTK